MNQSGVYSVTPQKRRRGRPRKNQNPLDSSLDTSSQFVHEESKNEQA